MPVKDPTADRPPEGEQTVRAERQSDVAIEAHAIKKVFFGVAANRDVDFDVRWGEVHALLGENGAGKSTLCSVLAGLYRPDSGEIRMDGTRVEFRSPHDALAAGVGMVYQHFRLVDNFSVAENIALGHEGEGRLSRKQIEAEVAELGDTYEMPVDPKAQIWQLSVGEQQRVEILKQLHGGVEILILDEPTAVLTLQETEALFHAIRLMAAEGKAVVFVSHKLEEVLSVADRVTVLRDAEKVGEVETKDADAAALARMMVGREVNLPEREANEVHGNTVLAVKNLTVAGDRGFEAVRGVDLEVRGGQIVGVAGVAGNGQRELAEALAGLRPAESGEVRLNGKDITNASPRARIREGFGFVPEDRLGMGLSGGLSLEDNLVLKVYRRPPYRRGLRLSSRAIRAEARKLTEEFDIRGSVPGMPVRFLSGGNLQKAILAREISQQPKALIAGSPTRGLDISAIAAVRRLLLEEREKGTAILLLSEDLDELRSMADVIVVMYEGQIVGEAASDEFDPEQVGLMMAGVDPSGSARQQGTKPTGP